MICAIISKLYLPMRSLANFHVTSEGEYPNVRGEGREAESCHPQYPQRVSLSFYRPLLRPNLDFWFCSRQSYRTRQYNEDILMILHHEGEVKESLRKNKNKNETAQGNGEVVFSFDIFTSLFPTIPILWRLPLLWTSSFPQAHLSYLNNLIFYPVLQ